MSQQIASESFLSSRNRAGFRRKGCNLVHNILKTYANYSISKIIGAEYSSLLVLIVVIFHNQYTASKLNIESKDMDSSLDCALYFPCNVRQ